MKTRASEIISIRVPKEARQKLDAELEKHNQGAKALHDSLCKLGTKKGKYKPLSRNEFLLRCFDPNSGDSRTMRQILGVDGYFIAMQHATNLEMGLRNIHGLVFSIKNFLFEPLPNGWLDESEKIEVIRKIGLHKALKDFKSAMDDLRKIEKWLEAHSTKRTSEARSGGISVTASLPTLDFDASDAATSRPSTSTTSTTKR